MSGAAVSSLSAVELLMMLVGSSVASAVARPGLLAAQHLLT